MAEKKLYGAGFGPYLYDDTDAIDDPDGDFTGFTMFASITDGGHLLGFLNLLDTNQSNSLKVYWNEDDNAERVLSLLVSGGDRILTLAGDLTVEAASVINQDVTTDADVSFRGYNIVCNNNVVVCHNDEVVTV